jgi:hypothetical protein
MFKKASKKANLVSIEKRISGTTCPPESFKIVNPANKLKIEYSITF